MKPLIWGIIHYAAIANRYILHLLRLASSVCLHPIPFVTSLNLNMTLKFPQIKFAMVPHCFQDKIKIL